MSKPVIVIAIMGVIAAATASAAPGRTVILDQSVDALPELPVPLPDSVSVSFVPARSSDGGGSVQVEYAGPEPRSVVLFEATNPGAEDCAVWYEAAIRGEGVKGNACLELWCDFGDAQYFSRGLDQTISGDADWRTARIPFFLEAGQRPKRFLMGIRMEGPGTVWVDDVALTQGPLGAANAAGAVGSAVLGGILGLCGAVCGIWGAFAGYMAPRGKARGFVVVSGWLLTAFSIAMLSAGVILTGVGVRAGWPALLAGLVLTAVMLPLNFVVRRAYHQAELRRMSAQDLA